MKTKTLHERSAFTLVELLVVIGIIAVLISVLLPVLSSARKTAEKTKCLAAMQQIGQAYRMYANENQGYWPICAHFYTSTTGSYAHRDKRWHDFIARYTLNGPQQVIDKATGKVYAEKDMNFNGTCGNEPINASGTTYATHGDFGTKDDPLWIGTMRDRNSVLWGCASWNRMGTSGTQYEYGANNGYAMSIFPKAPNDNGPGLGGLDPKKTAWIIDDPYAGSLFKGSYFKMTAWTKPAERALLFDGIHNGGYWTDAATNFQPWQYPFFNTPLPQFPVYTFPIDWNRHSTKKVGKVQPNTPALNMLFCDGHATTVSAYQAWKAIRFKS